jgi:choline dehydrogenase-like flavoprotein
MIIDARELKDQESISCDVCIVGAGPAGIVLAFELAEAGMDVVLLESGGTKFEAATNDLNKGNVVDLQTHGPLEDYRRRRLGGASTAWGGRCAPFDEIDFERRAYVPNSGWPFGKSEVDPFVARAQRYLNLGTSSYDTLEDLPPEARERPMIPQMVSEILNVTSKYLFSPPIDFGARFGKELTASQRVRVYLYANCLDLAVRSDGTQVQHIEAATINGNQMFLSAKQYVLASGGLEVTRLMLASNRVHRNGIGNEHDLLGRYYMCHVTNHLDIEFASGDIVWDYEKTIDGVFCQRTLSINQTTQRKLGLFNHRARIEHPAIEDPGHGNGVLSTAFLVKWLMRAGPIVRHLSPTFGILSRGVVDVATPERSKAARRNLRAHAANVLFDFPAVIGFCRRWMKERILSERKLPSIALFNKAKQYTLRIDAEQVPNPQSRVTLGNDLDLFKQRRLAVDWRFTDADILNLAFTAETIGEALADSGAARVKSIRALDVKATGGHHIGTTRMAESASEGVVDPNCRVHGISNLFIASSSVFPTCSYANPTLMIVALAIRLSEHLKRKQP